MAFVPFREVNCNLVELCEGMHLEWQQEDTD